MFTEFKTLKNEIASLIRLNKKDYYNRFFINNKKKLRKTWEGIKEIINIKTKNFNCPSFIKIGNKVVTDGKSISKSFNEYFASIAEKILNSRKYEGNKSHNDYLLNSLPNSFVLRECEQLEVENLITDLNSKKASGSNSIPVYILSLVKSDISKHLSKIFNLSLSTGIYPDKLKIAKTIPISKKVQTHILAI